MSTGPPCSCEGDLYSFECSCAIPGSRSVAKGGTHGTWQLLMATITLSATNRQPPAETRKRSPCWDNRSTVMPPRTGSSIRCAYASR